jgi:hypothetical protein
VAVYDVDMTMEEIMAPVEQLPPNHYVMTYEGMLKDEMGSIYFPTRSGGTSVKLRFRTVSPDPVQNGRGVIYQAVLGQFTLANVLKCLHIMPEGKFDDEADVNTQIEVDIGHREVVTKDAQGKPSGEKKTYLSWNRMKRVV